MRIYRSSATQAAIRSWCEHRLDRADLDLRRQVVATPLGLTHVTQAGRSGPEIVVLPGTNFNAATSLTLLGRLAHRFRTSVVDVVGQPGLSAADRPDHDRVTGYRRWLDSVVAQVCDGPAILVGHSLGAAIALCATPGPRIAGVVCVCPGGLIPARMTAPMIGASLPWLVCPTPRRSARLLSVMAGPAAARAGDTCPDPELAQWMTLVASGTYTSLSPRPLPENVLEPWRTSPVSVLAGGGDCFFPPALLARCTRLWLSRDVQTVAGCGHLLPFQSPGSVVDAVATLAADVR